MNSFKEDHYLSAPSSIKLEIDSFYSENDLHILGLSKMNNHKMDYLVFEKDERVYFFEKIDKKLLRLFCCTSKQSFYLS